MVEMAISALDCACVCPRSLPIIGSPMPAPAATLAKLWRRSCRRTLWSRRLADAPPRFSRFVRTRLAADDHVGVVRDAGQSAAEGRGGVGGWIVLAPALLSGGVRARAISRSTSSRSRSVSWTMSQRRRLSWVSFDCSGVHCRAGRSKAESIAASLPPAPRYPLWCLGAAGRA